MARGAVARSSARPCRSRVFRELVDEHGDVEQRAGATQVTQVARVRGGAQRADVGLEVACGPVYVADAGGHRSDPERVDGAGFDRSAIAGSQAAPRAVDQQLELAVEHLVGLGDVRVDVRLRRPAARRQLPLHLEQGAVGVPARAGDRVDRSVRPRQPLAHGALSWETAEPPSSQRFSRLMRPSANSHTCSMRMQTRRPWPGMPRKWPWTVPVHWCSVTQKSSPW